MSGRILSGIPIKVELAEVSVGFACAQVLDQCEHIGCIRQETVPIRSPTIKNLQAFRCFAPRLNGCAENHNEALRSSINLGPGLRIHKDRPRFKGNHVPSAAVVQCKGGKDDE